MTQGNAPQIAPAFVDACRHFLLQDEHPALRRSFRSRHFGGAVERQVLRLLRRRNADGRLKRAWHWLVPLALVWVFILVMIFGVFLPNIGITAPLYNTYLRDPVEAYVEISMLFTIIMTTVMMAAQPVTHLIATWVTRELRLNPEIQDLALSTTSRRELASALWMRMMVGYRVFEVFGAVNLANLFLALLYWHAQGRLTAALAYGPVFSSAEGTGLHYILLVFVIFTLAYTPGLLGSRRGALDGLIAGFLDLRGTALMGHIVSAFVRQTLYTLLLMPAIILLLPVVFLVLIMLAFADYPLLYMLVGQRDFSRLVHLIHPHALEDGISSEEWRRADPSEAAEVSA